MVDNVEKLLGAEFVGMSRLRPEGGDSCGLA